MGAPTFSSLESSNFLIERGRVFIYINLGVRACTAGSCVSYFYLTFVSVCT